MVNYLVSADSGELCFALFDWGHTPRVLPRFAHSAAQPVTG